MLAAWVLMACCGRAEVVVLPKEPICTKENLTKALVLAGDYLPLYVVFEATMSSANITLPESYSYGWTNEVDHKRREAKRLREQAAQLDEEATAQEKRDADLDFIRKVLAACKEGGK